MPDDYPDFPSHAQLLAYFERYVEHFGFRHTITFRTEVVRVEPAAGGTYDVTVRHRDSGVTRTERYGAVIVASGHHWCPNWPEVPGTFEGEVMHARDYRTPDVLRGKRVLVVGAGNSACDIACEAAYHARAVLLSTRRGAHVIPKYLLGRPLDLWLTPFTSRLPLAVQRALFRLLVYLTRGNQRRYGFPVPDYPLGAEHPTISTELLPLIGHGRIRVKPDLRRLEGRQVHFADGTTETIDLIIYATGYRVVFPFFDPAFLEVRDNYLPRYLHVVPPDHPICISSDWCSHWAPSCRWPKCRPNGWRICWKDGPGCRRVKPCGAGFAARMPGATRCPHKTPRPGGGFLPLPAPASP